MTYSEIIERAFTFLYLNNIECPRIISYPIFKRIRDEGVFDMFFILKDENSALCQENIELTFLCEIGGDRAGFWTVSNNENCAEENIALDYGSLSSEDEESFGNLYEKVREFVFKKDISTTEKKLALQLAKKYEKDLSGEVYHFLSYEFFAWVKELG